MQKITLSDVFLHPAHGRCQVMWYTEIDVGLTSMDGRITVPIKDLDGEGYMLLSETVKEYVRNAESC